MKPFRENVAAAPMAKHHCRLRKLRKTAGLSQRELAYLIGLRSQSQLSEIEAGLKRPSITVALASALVLDVPVGEIFPGLLANAQENALERARRLHPQIGAASRAQVRSYVAAIIGRLGEL
jgi:transcriptional regulator with XRE-family HTH domain